MPRIGARDWLVPSEAWQGSDVATFALADGRAQKFLTVREREELRARLAERKAHRDAKVAAERRLHHEVICCWKDSGQGYPPVEISLQDDRCWDVAAGRLQAWDDNEAADQRRDAGSQSPDDAHPRMMRRIMEVFAAQIPAQRARARR